MVDSLKDLQSVYEKWEGRGNKARLKSQESQDVNKVISEGKQRWRNKYGDSIRPPPVRRTRERRNFPKLRPVESVQSDNIAAFKTMPIVTAEAFRVNRPFMGQCCACLPTSRRMMTGTCTQMGLRNILNVQHELRNRGPLARCFCHLAYLLQRRIFYKYTNVSVAVLACGRVYNAVHQKPPASQDITTDEGCNQAEEDKAVRKREKRAQSILSNMQANVSSVLVSFTGWFLLKFLSLMISSIQVHKGQMQLVKKATEKNVPMISVPLHRSHLDYILVTFLLWNYDIKAPHICAGDNLSMPIFSYLMRGLGAFFIRRRLDKQRGKKDILYRSTLQSYVEELLRNGEGIEFFIEGGRTRTGKACYPKTGLLSVIVDAFRSDVIEDAYIVPVTINYEKLLDGNFNNELLGKRKVKETFWASIKGIWRVMRGDFGHVRAGFCQPFSLKEFMVTQACQSSRCQDTSSQGSDSPTSPATPEDSPDSPPEGFSSRRGSFSSLLGSEVVDSDQKEIVENLGQHIVYGAVNGTALMSTNLLAFLLLNKHRQGVSLISLTDSFVWLQDQLSARKRDVGFSGNTEDVISHALYLLGEELAVTSADKNGNQIIEPNTTVPSVFELSYYSNSVISVFLLESVLVNAVLGVTDSVNSQASEPLSADRERILDMAADICHLFRNEFIFSPTCEELRQVLAETVEDLVLSELFYKEETKVQGAFTTAERQWAKRFTESLEWQTGGSDSDDDIYPAHHQVIKVKLNDPEVMERVLFLRGILGPYVEGYWMTALTITKLREREMAEEDFMKLLHTDALKRVEKDLATYPESTSMEILRNAMKTYQEQKLINTYFAGNLKMVELRDNYQVEEQLHDLLDFLESLRE